MPMAAHILPPPLREGDRLTSDEFMRRWQAMPDLKHAELIDGIVYMASPVSNPHSRFHFILGGWLSAYELATPGCEGGMEGTWLMGSRNVPQPDTTLRILPKKGGQSRDEGDYTAGAPELVVEIAVSSRTRDLGIKKEMYQRVGVQEYLVAVTRHSKLIWNTLTPDGYKTLEPDPNGILHSLCFPGLWLDTGALWSQDKARLHGTLQQGIATPEHTAFVERLAESDR